MKSFNMLPKFFISLLFLGSFLFLLYADVGSNGTCASPEVIELNSTQSCQILSGTVGEGTSADVDIYRIHMTEDTNLTITLLNTSGTTKLEYAHGSTCNDSPSTTTLNNSASFIHNNLSVPGDYYFYLTGGSNNAESPYSITFDYNGSCGGGGLIIDPSLYTANVDIVDQIINVQYEAAINTKISNKPNYQMKAYYLAETIDDTPNADAVYSGDIDMTIKYYLTDAISNSEEHCNAGSTIPLYTTPDGTTSVVSIITDGDSYATSNSFTMAYTQALLSKKDVRFKYKAVDFNGLIDAAGISCPNSSINGSASGTVTGIPACVISNSLESTPAERYKKIFGDAAFNRCWEDILNGEPCNSNTNQSDLPEGMYDDPEYACMECSLADFPFVCSTDNFAIRPDTYTNPPTVSPNGTLVAGEDFNLTVIARGYGDVDITGYDGNATVSPLTPLVACEVDDGNLTNDINTSASPLVFNGVDTNVSNNIKFGDIGVFDINITDSTWSAVDSVKSPAECIVGSNTNVADVNGKIGCDVSITFQKIVIPDHFDVNGTLSNRSSGFTYLHNNEANASKDGNISAIFDLNVYAKSAVNTPTLNYSSDCYAQDGNSTINFVFTPAISPDGNLTTLLGYDDNNHSATGFSGIITDNNASIAVAQHSAERFNDGNGTLRYRLNFDRNVTMAVNPFMMSIPQVDVEDNDTVTGSTIQPIDNNATYVYGRVIARDVRIFGQKPFRANAWYEIFSQTPPTIGATALAPSKTYTNWFIMAPHNDAQDGDASVTHMQTNGEEATDSPLFDTVTYASGIETYIENGGWNINSYKAHILTAPWLWYGINALDYVNPATGNDENACLTHPCFNINVVPEVGATGSAKEDARLKKANKGTNDGTGGAWKSTSDYAPAVR